MTAMIPHSSSQICDADFSYIPGIVQRNFLGDGPLCTQLRAALRDRFGCARVTLTNSATSALRLSLLALREGSPERQHVILGSYVCPAVVSAVHQAGLSPLFADLAPASLSTDPASVRIRAEQPPLAVICTNAGGVPDCYDAAERLGIPLISDCAQAVGTHVDGRDLASRGCCAVLSFGATKMITAGSGGALLCYDEDIGSRIADLAREELPGDRYSPGVFPVTWGQQMGELMAGLALARLSCLDEAVARRRLIAERYDRALDGWGAHRLRLETPGERLNRFRYFFFSEQADIWVEHLRAEGIDARRSISHPMGVMYGTITDLPQVHRWSNAVVSVPIHPTLTDAEVGQIVRGLESGPGRWEAGA